jgi:peptidoglycan/xylan/chitin deacetylase (PgdA/CDA1 family)
MNVFLTFDIEVWCNGWDDLERAFPVSFDRYIYGRSRHGEYALPQTLAILNRHGLKGVFFVEPLFAARFGTQHLDVIVQMIRRAGHEVQLHLHPEWTDEAIVPLIKNCATKRQHLSYYSLDEQTTLMAHGKRMLEAAGSGPIRAFRSGSYAVNRDSFEALRRNAIWLDSSLNRCFVVSAPELRKEHPSNTAFEIGGVTTYPVTVLKDGFGGARPAQLGACGFGEMRDALHNASRAGVRDFVLVSHNFEMLRSGSSTPDWIVVRRFEQLCAFLENHSGQFIVRGFSEYMPISSLDSWTAEDPRASWLSTLGRHIEQGRRRLYF